VDDNEENLYLLRVLLQGYAFEVATAHEWRQCAGCGTQNPPHLIITDILMPVMDGFTLCREWKKDEQLKSIPFIFYSATYTDERDKEFGLNLGADLFIVKPRSRCIHKNRSRDIRQIENTPKDPSVSR